MTDSTPDVAAISPPPDVEAAKRAVINELESFAIPDDTDRDWDKFAEFVVDGVIEALAQAHIPEPSSPEPVFPVVRVTKYTVSMTPEDNPPGSTAWNVHVEYRGNERWAVTILGRCLGADGEWDHEPSPSNREDNWLSQHRFTEEEAVRLALQVAPTVTLNGKSARDLQEGVRA